MKPTLGFGSLSTLEVGRVTPCAPPIPPVLPNGLPQSGRVTRLASPILVLLSLGVLSSVAVLFFFNPSQSSFYPVCLFHQTTGLLCPGCGSLRALHQLLHGNLAAAFHFNALLISSLPILAWLSIRLALDRLHSDLRFSLHPKLAMILPLPRRGGEGWGEGVVHREASHTVVPSAIPPLIHQPPRLVIRPAWLWFALAVVLAFGILRNLPFPQLSWLAP